MSQITYDFDKLLKQYPGFFKALCDFVDKIREHDSLSETILAIEKKLQDAKTEGEAFAAAMAEKNKKLEEEHSARIIQLNAAEAEQRREINARRRALDVENEQRIQTANDEKDKILAQATNSRVAIETRIADLDAIAIELESKIDVKSAVLAEIDASIEARQRELDRIKNSIAELRAKIA